MHLTRHFKAKLLTGFFCAHTGSGDPLCGLPHRFLLDGILSPILTNISLSILGRSSISPALDFSFLSSSLT